MNNSNQTPEDKPTNLASEPLSDGDLSSKGFWNYNLEDKKEVFYKGEDVKEFIKKLKKSNESNFLYGSYAGIMDEVIDKLAGSDLT